jgi:flagellar biosynthesis protein FlhF
MAHDSMSQIEQIATAAATLPSAPELSPVRAETAAPVERDVERLAMSTLSFQDYVRERLLRRRRAALTPTAPAAAASSPAAPTPAAAPRAAQREVEPQASRFPDDAVAPIVVPRAAPAMSPPAPRERTPVPPAHPELRLPTRRPASASAPR